MFFLTGDTITISRGDTGTIVAKTSGSKMNPEIDRVLFTVKSSAGEEVIQRILTPADDETNTVIITLSNRDTDYLTPGNYTYDLRYVVEPYYDEKGNIIDGLEVITPKTPQTLTILTTAGEI